MKRYQSYILILFIFSSCTTRRAVLKSVVEKNLVRFTKNEIPVKLIEQIQDKRIIVLGETHYIQEHHVFISNLFDELSKVNKQIVFLQELPSAFNWMLDDFFNMKIDTLPESLKYFDEYLFKKVQKTNLEKSTNCKISYFYIDINHGKSFLTSIIESEKIIGTQTEFQRIKNVSFDSEEYTAELNKLLESITINKKHLISKWSERWYDRYFKMINNEVISCEYRKNNKNAIREKFMFNSIKEYANNYKNAKIIVNCGMYHGQKDSQLSSYKKAGEMLNKYFINSTYTLAFIGMKGWSKNAHWYNKTIKYNLLDKANNNNLVKIIAENSNSLNTFLPLFNPVFERKTIISYHIGKEKKVIPKKQFDGIVTYNYIGILNSMKKYEFNGF